MGMRRRPAACTSRGQSVLPSPQVIRQAGSAPGTRDPERARGEPVRRRRTDVGRSSVNPEELALPILRLSGKRGKGHRGRREGADTVRQRGSRELPVQSRVGLLHPRSEGGVVIVLATGGKAPGCQTGEGLDQEFGAHGCKASEEFAPGLGLSDCGFPLEQYRPGIQAGVHKHGCDPGSGETAGHRPDGRSGAAEFGE